MGLNKYLSKKESSSQYGHNVSSRNTSCIDKCTLEHLDNCVRPCSDQYNTDNKNKEQENNSAHNNFLDCPVQIKDIWNDKFQRTLENIKQFSQKNNKTSI